MCLNLLEREVYGTLLFPDHKTHDNDMTQDPRIDEITSLIRTIPDFPKEGIQFRDITTLLQDPKGLKHMVDLLVERYSDKKIDLVAGIESRGFVIGAPVAIGIGAGFVMIRKKGKLPFKTISQQYLLEYGEDSIEVHEDAIKEGQRVLVVDDLIATGGTLKAACQLIEKLNGEIVECVAPIELPALNGKEFVGREVFSLVKFEGH